MNKETGNSAGFSNEFSLGNISEILSSAFGGQALEKPGSGSIKNRRLRELKKNSNEKDTFLTEAEMNEIEQEFNAGSTAMSYEEMIKEIDELSSGMKSSHCDLMDLQRRIDRCMVGIKEQESSYKDLDKATKEIRTQSKAIGKSLEPFLMMPSLNSS